MRKEDLIANLKRKRFGGKQPAMRDTTTDVEESYLGLFLYTLSVGDT